MNPFKPNEMICTRVTFNPDYTYEIKNTHFIGEFNCGFIFCDKKIEPYPDSDEETKTFDYNIFQKVMGMDRLSDLNNRSICVIYYEMDKEIYHRKIRDFTRKVIFDRIEKVERIKNSIELFLKETTQMKVFEDLIGKTVNKIMIENGGYYIRIVTNTNEKFDYVCEGDCCADAYVNHISGIDAILNQEVISVDEYEFQGDQNEYEVSDYTRYVINTVQGSFEIELRVDHNGYYGGMINRCYSNINVPSMATEDF